MVGNFVDKSRYFILKFLEKFGYFYPKRLQYRSLARFFYFKELYDQIENVPGGIVECGVAFGESLIVLATLAKQEGKNRRVYGFDSFQGFPKPSIFDKSPRNVQKGEYRDAQLARVRKMIKKAYVPEPTLIKGFVEDTTTRYDGGAIAFLHIDLDLYEGYKAVLENLFAKVSSGGIIVFDDYCDPNWPGATKAVDEFLSGTYTPRKAKYVDRYYIVK